MGRGYSSHPFLSRAEDLVSTWHWAAKSFPSQTGPFWQAERETEAAWGEALEGAWPRLCIPCGLAWACL